jgi:prepilin-type N-terminal cleavage/methylation domain-containing protein
MPIQIRPNRTRQAAFTLVELLVVVGIIALLMGILIPVVAGVKKKGYEVRTKALIAKISAGCHAYYGDWRAYPGIVDEDNVAGGPNANPNIKDATSGGNLACVTSTENLVLSLLGGLTAQGGQLTFDYNLVKTGPQSLNPAEPKQYQAYIEVQTGELSPYGKDPNGKYITKFTPPSSASSGTSDSAIPEFVDAYTDQQPIIYMRARPGRTGIIDDSISDPRANDAQYSRLQIQPYYDTPTGSYDPAKVQLLVQPTFDSSKPFPKSWADYFRNQGLTSIDATGRITGASEVPRGKDSFVIFSAGTDRHWFSGDDVFFGD